MNERIRAIFVAALKLPPGERAVLAQTLMDTLAVDPDEAERLYADEPSSSSATDEAPQQPPSDVLAKYLDI